MKVRLWRKKRRRSGAFAERFALSPLDAAPADAPPAMWLPPLRPVLPEGAPVGISLGAFKPQRDVEREFWPGPPVEAAGQWEAWMDDFAMPQAPRRRALAAIAGLVGGAVLALAIGAIVAAPGDLTEPLLPSIAAIQSQASGPLEPWPGWPRQSI